MSAKGPSVFLKTAAIDDAVTMFVDGKVYEGWEDMKVTRELNAAASDFNLSLVDKWRADKEPWRISVGQKCHLHAGKKSIVTGYIDSMDVSVAADARSVQIAGRSKTADLVDCSVEGPNTYANLNVFELAKTLCKPFGISVVTSGSAGAAFASITVQQGETVFTLIDRLARQRNLLMYPSVEGSLIIGPVGTRRAVTEIRQGVNVLSGRAKFDNTNRFSKYVAKGQDLAFLGGAEQSASPQGTAFDNGVSRYRPLVIMAENTVDGGSSDSRASYEAELRAAQSLSVDVQVQGWFQANGDLWDVNMLAFVDVGFLGVRREMLIKKVEFNKGSGGTTTTLTFIRKDAFGFKKQIAKEDPLGWTKFVK